MILTRLTWTGRVTHTNRRNEKYSQYFCLKSHEKNLADKDESEKIILKRKINVCICDTDRSS